MVKKYYSDFINHSTFVLRKYGGEKRDKSSDDSREIARER